MRITGDRLAAADNPRIVYDQPPRRDTMKLKVSLVRVFRFCGLLARDKRLPAPVRYGLAVCLLIPGPVDELLAIPAVVAVLVWRRHVVVDCWRRSRPERGLAAVVVDGEVVFVEVPR